MGPGRFLVADNEDRWRAASWQGDKFAYEGERLPPLLIPRQVSPDARWLFCEDNGARIWAEPAGALVTRTPAGGLTTFSICHKAYRVAWLRSDAPPKP